MFHVAQRSAFKLALLAYLIWISFAAVAAPIIHPNALNQKVVWHLISKPVFQQRADQLPGGFEFDGKVEEWSRANLLGNLQNQASELVWIASHAKGFYLAGGKGKPSK